MFSCFFPLFTLSFFLFFEAAWWFTFCFLWDVSSIVFCTQRRGSWHDWLLREHSGVSRSRFQTKAWWDFLLETPGREMTITGESDFSPGLSSSTTLVQPTYFLWGQQLQLLFASDFGVWPSAAYQVSISIQVWASLACGGSQVWVMWERGPCWWLWDTDAPWQSSTSQDADNKHSELKLSQTHFEFLLIKSSTRRSYLV